MIIDHRFDGYEIKYSICNEEFILCIQHKKTQKITFSHS